MPSFGESVRNLELLLRPDGILFMAAPYDLPRATRYVLGCLQAGDRDKRPIVLYESCVSVQRWDVEFKSAGYTGVESAVYNDEEPFSQAAVFVSEKQASLTPTKVAFPTKDRHSTSMQALSASRKWHDAAWTTLCRPTHLVPQCPRRLPRGHFWERLRRVSAFYDLFEVTKAPLSAAAHTAQVLKSGVGKEPGSGWNGLVRATPASLRSGVDKAEPFLRLFASICCQDTRKLRGPGQLRGRQGIRGA